MSINVQNTFPEDSKGSEKDLTFCVVNVIIENLTTLNIPSKFKFLTILPT